MNRKSSALTAGRLRPQPQILRPTTAALAAVHRFFHTATAEAVSRMQAHTRTDRVTSIQCGRCATWVKPRRYDPDYNVCTTCLPAAKADHRAEIRATERRLGLI